MPLKYVEKYGNYFTTALVLYFIEVNVHIRYIEHTYRDKVDVNDDNEENNVVAPQTSPENKDRNSGVHILRNSTGKKPFPLVQNFDFNYVAPKLSKSMVRWLHNIDAQYGEECKSKFQASTNSILKRRNNLRFILRMCYCCLINVNKICVPMVC